MLSNSFCTWLSPTMITPFFFKRAAAIPSPGCQSPRKASIIDGSASAGRASLLQDCISCSRASLTAREPPWPRLHTCGHIPAVAGYDSLSSDFCRRSGRGKAPAASGQMGINSALPSCSSFVFHISTVSSRLILRCICSFLPSRQALTRILNFSCPHVSCRSVSLLIMAASL